MNISKVILFSDMDDTLFNDQKIISSENTLAIRDFQDQGGIFSVASGRSISGFRPYAKQLNIQTPVILYNGSCVYDYNKEQMIWSAPLPECMKSYIDIVRKEYPEVGVQVLTEQAIFSLKSTPIYLAFMEKERLPYIEVADKRDIEGEWLKVEFISDTVDGDQLDAFLDETMPNEVRCLRTGEYSKEIVETSVSKGEAVKKYCEKLDFLDKYICCIGDHNNDKEMLLNADVSFAVQNALPEIKEIANLTVCDNNHHALREVIEILKRMDIEENERI